MPACPAPRSDAPAGWRARLELEFERAGDRTLLARRRHEGPLAVQRAFYPEGPGTSHVYLLHPPGGVVGGDVLEIEVRVGPEARALVTTPAAGKFYRSAGLRSDQSVGLRVEQGGFLEWLPQETLVFDGAVARSRTRVDLAGGAGFLGWEITCLGLAELEAPFRRGSFDQGLQLWREGRPLLLERARLDGGSGKLRAPWGLAGRPVTGTLVCTGADATLVDSVREAAAELGGDDLIGATRLGEVLVCRYLGHCTERARRHFARAWEVLRPAVARRAACPPRIWKT